MCSCYWPFIGPSRTTNSSNFARPDLTWCLRDVAQSFAELFTTPGIALITALIPGHLVPGILTDFWQWFDRKCPGVALKRVLTPPLVLFCRELHYNAYLGLFYAFSTLVLHQNAYLCHFYVFIVPWYCFWVESLASDWCSTYWPNLVVGQSPTCDST